MHRILPKIEGPEDLKLLDQQELEILCQEMRDELVRVLSLRPAHFASNLGVVELCVALHLSYDFTKDRIIWDTGHQIYPHKLITGRYRKFDTIRTKGGLMGYPNPAESDYDLFMTGHAGCSLSTALGLKVGDDLNGNTDRHSIAVIGDGALPSGIVFEALNNAGGLDKNLLVILNDNEMSICPRVGSLAKCLDQARLTSLYQDSKRQIKDLLEKIPFGSVAKQALEQLKDGLKASLMGGRLFEEFGFRYFGPIDGHDLPGMLKWFANIKEQKGPILLHVLTQKGCGVPQASEDPVTFHTPPVFEKVGPERTLISMKMGGSKGYTDAVSSSIFKIMQENKKVCVITAAMCQGNKLEKIREVFPERFFDVGICESHAVAFAAGLAKTGNRPIVDIYSTFLQRSFDQVFQEVSLQNLPVLFCLDRAGITGPDGPTHHGAFDNTYMRVFPNMTVMAPGDELDVEPMIRLSLAHNGPTVIRYPKANLERIKRDFVPLEIGQAEVLEWGDDITLIGYGTLLGECCKAAEILREEGFQVGIINARFLKPLDKNTLFKAMEESNLVVTIEEGSLEGGFGSALLEAANSAGIETRKLIRLGLPDSFVEHGERTELLHDLGLDAIGIANTAKQWFAKDVSASRQTLGK